MEINDIIETAKKIAIKLQELSCAKIEILDISKKSTQIKVLVLANAENAQTSKVIAGDLKLFLQEQSIDCIGVDGGLKGEWIVFDCDKIMVHLFTEATRTKFNLEKLWKDSKNVVKWR